MKTLRNITMIGMPGSGKSTVGVLLAKKLGYGFIDSDLLIQQRENRLLEDIIAQEGLEGFIRIEDQVNSSIEAEHTVIAPGGSICYCSRAMSHLSEISLVVYLKISCESLEQRLGDLKKRGVVLQEGMTLRDLFEERVPLYEKYADLTLEVDSLDMGGVLEAFETCAAAEGFLCVQKSK